MREWLGVGSVFATARTWCVRSEIITDIHTCSLRTRPTKAIQAAWATLLGVARSATGMTVSMAMVPFSRNTSSK